MNETTRNILIAVGVLAVAYFATREDDEQTQSPDTPPPGDGGGGGVDDTISGCTDASATNYDPTANVDDGSCVYPVFGCTDSLASNYNPDATADDGNCIYPVPGCTDPAAYNYDPSATEDNGTCIPVVYGCMEEPACNYNPDANTDDGSCEYPGEYTDCDGNCYNDVNGDGICDETQVFGCTDDRLDENGFYIADNYDPNATADDGSCVYIGCRDEGAANYDPQANAGDDQALCIYAGCTNQYASNYDPNADIDDGSCLPVPGCTTLNADNFDPNATEDDGSCIISGCTNAADPDNYNPAANNDDGSCVIRGCMDSTADEGYNPEATVDDGSCVYYGCMNPLATGNPETGEGAYDDTANFDDGSCIIPGCTDPSAQGDFDGNGAYGPQYNFGDPEDYCIYRGCTLPSAENYNPQATIDDGSCILYGCTDSEALNWNPLATIDDGNCTYEEEDPEIKGCMDPDALNYDDEANVPGACEYAGCMNPEADNYNPLATQEDPDNPCIISGCTSEAATNYNPAANNDDGSCEYDSDVPLQFIWGDMPGPGNHPVFGYALQAMNVVPEPCYGEESLGVVLGTSAQLGAETGTSSLINEFINQNYGMVLSAQQLNTFWSSVCATSGVDYKPLYNELTGFPMEEYSLVGDCIIPEPIIFGSAGEANQFWADYTGGQDQICNQLAPFFPEFVVGSFIPGATTPYFLGVMAQSFFSLPSIPFDEFGNIMTPWSDVSLTICASPDSGIENV